MTDEIDTSAETVERLADYLDTPGQGLVLYDAAATLRALVAERDAERQRAEKAEADAKRSWMDCNQEDLHFVVSHPEAVSRNLTKYRKDAEHWRQRAEKAESQAAGLAKAGDVLALRLRHIVGPEDIVLRWENARAVLRQDKGEGDDC